MDGNSLARKIRKKAAVKLMLSLPVLLAAAALVLFMFFSGMSATEGSLAALDDIAATPVGDGLTWVSLTVPADDIQGKAVQRNADGVTVGYYIAALVDRRIVICYVTADTYKTLGGGGGFTFSGVLKELGAKGAKIIGDVLDRQRFGASKILYPYFIDTTENGVADRVFLLAFTFLLLAFGLFVLITSLACMTSAKNYSGVKRLSGHGDVGSLFKQIAQEYAEKAALSLGRGRNAVFLGREWIVVESRFNVRLMRVDSLQRAYKAKPSIMLHSYTIANTCSFLVLKVAYRLYAILGLEPNVDEILSTIASSYPRVAMFRDADDPYGC
jgi:hypothetical protein